MARAHTAVTPRLDSPAVTARDRLVTTLFFAALLHGILILGVTFRPELPSGSPTLEVTMVQTRSATPPDEAQYLAQVDQRGAGNTTEQVRPESPLSMPAALNNAGRADAPDLQENPGKTSTSGKDDGADPDRGWNQDAAITTSAITGVNATARTAAPLSSEPRVMMARLLTPGDDALMPNDDGLELPQATDPKPREAFVAVNARASRYAPYLDAWRRKVERIGNLNFPAQIRTQHLSGSLSLEVALNSDGSIRELSMLSPSGQSLLDDSAQRIVKLAAPYQAFPADIRRDTGVLRFVYVWRFNGGKLDTRHSSIKSAASAH